VSARTQFRFDLLAWRPVDRLLRWRAFPLVFQLLTLTVLAVLVGIGLGVWPNGPDPATYAKTLRKTNLTTLIVWGLWWPGLILLTLALGRLWCTICPMELVSQVAWRVGGKLGVARLGMPRWLRAGWIVLLGYITLQLLVAGFSLHRIPALTAWMLLTILAVAWTVGLLFKSPRAFCQGFCPAAALLDAYGRLSPVQLAVRSESRCQSCTDKPCIDPARRARWDARACPSLLVPFARQPGEPCVLCFQCAKACPHGNVGFGWLRKDHPLRATRRFALPVAIFIFLAFGFVAHELFGEVKPLDQVFHAPAMWLSGLFGTGYLTKWSEAGWFLLILPGLLAGLVLLAGKLACRDAPWQELLTVAAAGLLPFVALGHAVKALAKATAWAPFLPVALREPRGVGTAEAILTGHVAPPARIVSLQSLGALAVAILLILLLARLARLRSAARGLAPVHALAITATVALYATIFAGWLGVLT